MGVAQRFLKTIEDREAAWSAFHQAAAAVEAARRNYVGAADAYRKEYDESPLFGNAERRAAAEHCKFELCNREEESWGGFITYHYCGQAFVGSTRNDDA